MPAAIRRARQRVQVRVENSARRRNVGHNRAAHRPRCRHSHAGDPGSRAVAGSSAVRHQRRQHPRVHHVRAQVGAEELGPRARRGTGRVVNDDRQTRRQVAPKRAPAIHRHPAASARCTCSPLAVTIDLGPVLVNGVHSRARHRRVSVVTAAVGRARQRVQVRLEAQAAEPGPRQPNRRGDPGGSDLEHRTATGPDVSRLRTI